MAKLALFIKSRTQPGKRAEVRSFWEEHLKPRAEANPAQKVYFFCEDDQDPEVFYLFELYNDRNEFTANAQQPWFADYMARVGLLLDGQPEIGMSTPYWVKGV